MNLSIITTAILSEPGSIAVASPAWTMSAPRGAETAAPRGCFANRGLSNGDTLPPSGTFGGYDMLREGRLG